MKKYLFIILFIVAAVSCAKFEPIGPDPAPSVPTNILVISSDYSSATVSWSPVENAVTYSWILKDWEGAICQTGKTKDCTILLEELVEGCKYSFCVRAESMLSKSDYSGSATVIPGGIIERVDHLRLAMPSGYGAWNVGDSVSVKDTLGQSAVFYATEVGGEYAYCTLADTSKHLVPGEMRVLWPAGCDSLAGVVPISGKLAMPMGCRTTGLSGTLAPLCGKITLLVMSDLPRSIKGLEISSKAPLSGKTAIDWSKTSPSLYISDNPGGIVVDFADSVRVLDKDTLVLTVLAPAGVYDSLFVRSASESDTLTVPSLVNPSVTIGKTGYTGCIIPDLMDWFSVYRSGLPITIGDKRISLSECSDYELKQPDKLSASSFSKEGGILFIDNSDENNVTWSYGSIVSVGAGRTFIGRYRNKKQAIISLADTKMLRLLGDVWIRNIRIETNSSTYGMLEGKQATDEDGKYTWNLEDCSLINSSAGIYRYNLASYAVPKSITLNNCIIRCAGPLFGVGKNSKAKDLPNISYLRTISMDNCVVAPYSATNTVKRLEADGIIVNLGSGSDNTYATDELAVSITDCSFYDMGVTTKQRGMIDVKTIGSIYMRSTVFHHSAVTLTESFYTATASQKCTGPGGVDITGVYTDCSLQGRGSKTNLWNDGAAGRTWSFTVTLASNTFDTDNLNPANDYFPAKVTASGSTVSAGATYNTKYWIK